MPALDLSRLQAIFENHTNVLAAWSFGSAQKGFLRPESDVDIGVYYERPPSLDELADLRADLQEALGVEEIDLVPLNEAHPLLRFEAICGRLLFVRNWEKMALFVALTAREAEDAQAFLETGLAYLREIQARDSELQKTWVE